MSVTFASSHLLSIYYHNYYFNYCEDVFICFILPFSSDGNTLDGLEILYASINWRLLTIMGSVVFLVFFLLLAFAKQCCRLKVSLTTFIVTFDLSVDILVLLICQQ